MDFLDILLLSFILFCIVRIVILIRRRRKKKYIKKEFYGDSNFETLSKEMERFKKETKEEMERFKEETKEEMERFKKEIREEMKKSEKSEEEIEKFEEDEEEIVSERFLESCTVPEYRERHYRHICPVCGNTEDFTPIKKGYDLGNGFLGGIIFGNMGWLAGFLGSGDVKLVCNRCGNEIEID